MTDKKQNEKAKPNTCGTCKHTDNKLGLFAYHCDLMVGRILKDGEEDDGKVRSWEKCNFKPSRYAMR